MSRLYGELAAWWPLLSPPEDYAEEAAFFRQVLEASCDPPIRTVLELGSGGGSNAVHLRSRFTLTLVDASPGMLEVSRALNPECEHLVGDLRTVRLGREFDAVFIHDAIEYMTTEEDLRRAMATAFVHCRPGGVALLVPDQVRETFEAGTESGGKDGEERSLRYLEWSLDPDPEGTTYVTHYAFLLREGGEVRVEHDRHTCGVFPRALWLRLLEEEGFRPRIVVDSYGRDLFVALKPGA